jgi:hypothetical protein
VRRQRVCPLGREMLWRFSCQSAIEENIALLIASNEVAEAVYVSDTAPAMRMQRHDIPRRYAGMNNAHSFVFQQQSVVGWGRNEGVERIWPRPG